MEDFFDLRRFLIILLRKVRVITLFAVIGFFAGTALQSAVSMLNYKPPQFLKSQNFVTAYTTQEVSLFIPIESVSGDAVAMQNRQRNLQGAYYAFAKSNHTLVQVIDQLQTQDDPFISYLQNFTDDIFTLIDDFVVVVNNPHYPGITLYVSSPDSVFTVKFSDTLLRVLSAQVQNVMGEHSALITAKKNFDGVVDQNGGKMEEPEKITNFVSAPTIRELVQKIIKVGIIGMAGGVFLSLVSLFLFSLTNTTIMSTEELKKYKITMI